MCANDGMTRSNGDAEPSGENGANGENPLAAFGALDTCRGAMRAYDLYRYNLFKEKYEKHGTITGQLGRAE